MALEGEDGSVEEPATVGVTVKLLARGGATMPTSESSCIASVALASVSKERMTCELAAATRPLEGEKRATVRLMSEGLLVIRGEGAGRVATRVIHL